MGKSRKLRYVGYTVLALIALLIILVASQVQGDMPVSELKLKYTNEASKFMEVAGLQVHYRDEGAGEPLLLIHGSGASLHTWDGWVTQLSDSFRVIRPDIPGFGLTGPNANHDYSMPAYIAFIEEFLDKLEAPNSHVAGNSLGGRIAWELALARPQRVRKLILIDATGFPMKKVPLGFKLSKNPLGRLIVRYLGSRKLIEKSLRDVYGDDSKITPELVTRYYEINLREGNRAAYIARANTVFSTPMTRIHEITVPTLILWGSDDPWSPPDNGRRFHSDLPHSELIIYDGVGHIPMEEIPRQSAQDARRFLLAGDKQE